MISVSHLVKSYGGGRAVDDISFEIHKGEIVGLLGPNGAGKTTTIRVMTGYLTPTEGEVTIENLDVVTHSREVRMKLGYLSEHSPLYEEMSVSEYLAFAAEMQGVSKEKITERVAQVIGECGLRGREHQDIRELSKGYRQRVGLAQSLIHDPEILILDEPTTGLDPNQRIEIRELIKKIGKEKTVILSSHILSEVEATCSRVLIIHRGKIVAEGTPEELKRAAHEQKRLEMELSGDAEALKQKLASFAGIETIQEIKETNGTIFVSLLLHEDTDIRGALSRFLFENGYAVLEFHQKEQSLEDVFVGLTREA